MISTAGSCTCWRTRGCATEVLWEVASDSTEQGRGSANLENRNGKREQGQALEEGKESRRRRI
jgi:hypothetical protein